MHSRQHRVFNVHSGKCNEEAISNLLDRQFGGQSQFAVIVSDLTYVRAGITFAFWLTRSIGKSSGIAEFQQGCGSGL